MASPGKGSIQWSPSPPHSLYSRSRQDSDSSRPYREYPTPHPKKLAEVAAHLKNSEGADDLDPRASAASPVRRPQPSFARPSPGDEAPRSSLHRPSIFHRSSSMESDFTKFQHRMTMQRTLSAAEEGAEEPPRPDGAGERHGGVVAKIIQYGLRRGMGGWSVGKRLRRARSASSLSEKEEKDGDEQTTRRGMPGQSDYLRRSICMNERRQSRIVDHVESFDARRKFILRLARTLLALGSPSHRIESQLHMVGGVLDAQVEFIHLPNLIIVTFMDSGTRTSETHFVRAGGRLALSKLSKVHLVYRDVLHDKIGPSEGCERLTEIMQEEPLYSIWVRCFLAFLCASIICVLSFGGSVVDMFVSGVCAAVLQYLGLNTASKSAMYANVYEISVSIIVSFAARCLGTIPGNLFCYSAISSAGVVLILPGFTILISALELTSRNILCGSVRMVYAIIYTLFLGFGLTIGSDFYLVVNPDARRIMAETNLLDSAVLHGYILNSNTSASSTDTGATFTFLDPSRSHFVKGCYRSPSWPWWRRDFPWWTVLFLVPIYSMCSSISNLQAMRTVQFPVMVLFSCAAYAANRTANYFISDRGDIVSAVGAFVIGVLGNTYSRIAGGTAFTSMVTGVLFLVPSAIGNDGGLIQPYNNSVARYSGSFELGIRMIQVAIGVTIGLFASQILVYALGGQRKSAAHFAF